MAHNLNMIPNSEDSAMLSADDMVAANIPANLKLVAGTFSTTITDPTLFQVNSKDDFDDAELGIKVAQGRKRRALANSHDGEKALLFHMYGSLFEATNGIIAAITGTPDVYWAVCTDSLESPCPDLILKAGDRNAAVIEVKTKADMSDEDADEIVANCERYHMTACMATAANTSVLSLVDSDVPTTRDARSRGVILAEEVSILDAVVMNLRLNEASGRDVSSRGILRSVDKFGHLDRIRKGRGRQGFGRQSARCHRRQEQCLVHHAGDDSVRRAKGVRQSP